VDFSTCRVDRYLFPARGRKRISRNRVPRFITVLIPTFSPQGDGNSTTVAVARALDTLVDPYLFPARGRKLERSESPGVVYLGLIPTFSPQGDGNQYSHELRL